MPSQLPLPSRARQVAAPPTVERVRPLGEQVAEIERAAIATALQATGGNRVAAARRLGMSRAALYDRLARWPDLASGNVLNSVSASA